MAERNIKQIDILNMCKPLCNKYNVKFGKSDLSQYVSGKVEPGQEKLSILAEALNVPETWLMGYDVPIQEKEYPYTIKDYMGWNESPPLMLHDEEVVYNADSKKSARTPYSDVVMLDPSTIYNIPTYNSVSAGFGTLAVDEIIDYTPLFFASHSEAAETICIRVKGDSMFPKIEDGDLIQVHKQSSVDSGSVAVILLDGEEGLVKKIEYGTDWIHLHSFNPMYPVMRFEGVDIQRISVVGLVKKVIKDL